MNKNIKNQFVDSFADKKSIKVPISKLKENERHTFKIRDDAEMKMLVESISEYGLLNPIVIRPVFDKCYEILAGHRRVRACLKNGMNEIDAIIIQADDENANLIMIMSNFTSRTILPSEIAKSYKLRYMDLKRVKGEKNSNEWNFGDQNIDKIMESEFGASKSKIYMYLHLSFLIEPLLDMLDERKLNLKIATKLSYLTEKEQKIVKEFVFDKKLFTLSLKKAGELKKESEMDKLDRDRIWEILAGDVDDKEVLYFSGQEIEKYMDKFESREEMKRVIIAFLESY